MAAQQPYEWKHRKEVLDSIMVVWAKFPYLRLGQLLENAVGRYGNRADTSSDRKTMSMMECGTCADLFNLSNEDLVTVLQKMEQELGKQT